jgi:preprotein translocase subunit SecD
MKKLYYHLGFSVLVTLIALWIVLSKPVNLGLDLKGGIEVILTPKLEQAIELSYNKYAESIIEVLSKNNFQVLDYKVSSNGILLEFLNPIKTEELQAILNKEFPGIFQITEKEAGKVILVFTHQYIKRLKESIIKKTIEVLRKRIDNLGVAQAVITRLGEKYIYIEIPGVLDIKRAKEIIGKTAKLEFLLVLGKSKDKAKLQLLAQKMKNVKILPGPNGEWYLLKYPPVITGADLQDAYPTTDSYGRPAVGFTLTLSAGKKFAEFTAKNIGKPMAIVLDNKVISAPIIEARIGSKGIITGQFTISEVKDLVVILKGGALPVDLEINEIRVIGPTLGKMAIKQGILAFIGGIILLFLILIARYKLAGFTAGLAVFHNALLLWAGLVALGATLTLPGIAGIILNMGIAVDSNVLIFERVREELRKKIPLLRAIEIGYKKALSAIIDSHITLLVAALILSQFDAGPVKGFAVTLAIGTLASFFSNVYMSKVLLDFIARKFPQRTLKI